MSLWDTITGNSTLPVQAANNFWDHLNNQAGGAGDIYVGVPLEAIVTIGLSADVLDVLDAEVENEILEAEVLNPIEGIV